MNYTKKYIENFAEFQEKFGKLNDGTERRKNKIFLEAMKSAYRSKNMHIFSAVVSSVNNDELISYVEAQIKISSLSKNVSKFSLLGKSYFSNNYFLDGTNGICEDLDVTAIRYKNSAGRVYKMKAGKFIRQILLENGVNEIVGETLTNFYCEIFTQKWQADALVKTSVQYSLKYDRDFEFIYNSDNYGGERDFGSCMTNNGYHVMYEDLYGCYAASIINGENKILARCIVWENVHEIESKKVWRLADRQYSDNVNTIHCQMLINALISDNKIDGYKKIGAGCGDARQFIGVNGEDLSERHLWIDFNLQDGDTISYMDTFKWYFHDIGKADNSNHFDGEYSDLATTYGTLEIEDNRNYDEYNEEYTDDELVPVRVWTGSFYREQSVSAEYASDNFSWSEYSNSYFDEAYLSEFFEDWLPLDEYESIEQDYKESNWNYDEYHEEYTDDDIVECNILYGEEYRTKLVSEKYADENFEFVDGVYYDKILESVPEA